MTLKSRTHTDRTAAYAVKQRGLPPMDRPQPEAATFRERGKERAYRPRGLYMEDRKTLNQWRMLRGLEITQLEEKAGVKGIGRLMYGGQKPGVEFAFKLAEALGVRVEQIIWEKAEKVDRDKLPPMPKSPPFDPRTMKVSVVSDEQMALVPVYAAAGWTKRDIYTEMGVSHNTFYKALEKYEAKHGPIMFVNARVRTPKPQAAQKVRKGPAKEGGKEKPSAGSRKAKKDAV